MWSVHINICITGYNWIKVHTYRHKGVCVCVYTWHMCVCMSVSQSSGTWLFSLHRLRLFPPHPAQQQWKNWHTCWPSVQFSCSVMSDSLRPHESQHARPPCPSPTPGVHSDSRPSSHWCHPAISSSVVPFSSCPQSLPASESFLMSQLFTWGGQSTGVSASASFLPKKSQGWSPSEWTGWMSLQSKGLSRVFSMINYVQIHQQLRIIP